MKLLTTFPTLYGYGKFELEARAIDSYYKYLTMKELDDEKRWAEFAESQITDEDSTV